MCIRDRDNGLSRGLGGSMHAFFLPFGIFPNNAIVGGSAPVGTGVALYKKCNKQKGIVVANAGDGAAGRGPVFESMNFAGMDQFNELWEEGYKGGLPIIFNFNNNSYGMGGQTKGCLLYTSLCKEEFVSGRLLSRRKKTGTARDGDERGGVRYVVLAPDGTAGSGVPVGTC